MQRHRGIHALNGDSTVKARLGEIAKMAVAAAALAVLLTFAAGLVMETQAKPAVDPVPSGARAGQMPFLGELSMIPYGNMPRGWLPADGRLMPINQNQALFALLGAKFGGDGVVTFRLPKLDGPESGGIGPGGKSAVRYIIAVQGIFPSQN